MKKLFLCLFFLLFLTLPVEGATQFYYGNTWHAHAVPEVRVTLDGIPVSFDVPPLIVENHTLIPARGLFEACGATVSWNEKLRQVGIEIRDTDILLTIDEKNILVNNKPYRMPLSAKIVTDAHGIARTMIPLRAVSEALSFRVDWNPQTCTANIDTIPYQSDISSLPLNPEVKKSVIVLDPGHGGSDPGIITTDEAGKIDIQEKDITLDITHRIKALLDTVGLTVITTRETDTYIELNERAAFANRENADIFVSVHCNSYIDSSMQGSMVYCYFSDNPSGAFSGKTLADTILTEIVQSVGTENKGVQNGQRFPVITETGMPAVIVETAFLSNANDKALLKSAEGRQKLAEAIAAGIIKSLNLLYPAI